jgi:tetratricopeptide (TPR) repeat protein
VIAAALLGLALGAGVDPCAPVAPAPIQDAAAAAEYRAVGDGERRAGVKDAAAAAYRSALALDPGDAAARRALAALCVEQRSASAFERGVRLMDAGDRAGAIEAFEEARASGSGPSAELLEGICLYEDGDDPRARPLLLAAERDAGTRDSARFFLGLIALREGRSRDAAALLEASAADRHLGPLALGLARDARRDGRLVLSLLLEGGYDSNVDLTPDGMRGAANAGDEAVGATAVVRATPFGATGPYVRLTGDLREQAQYKPLDLLGGGVAGGWQAGHGGRFVLAEYGYEYRDMGGAPYLSAQRLLAAGRLALVPSGALSAGALWSARWERFLADVDAGYSGVRQLADADLTLEPTRRLTARVAWHVGRDAANDPALAWWETGPRAAVRLVVAPDARLGIDAGWSRRTYDALDPSLGARRADDLVDVSALLEYDLAAEWTIRASLLGRKAFSNVAAFEYTKLVPMIGLAYTVGLL